MHKSQFLFFLLASFISGIFVASFVPVSYGAILVLLIIGIAALAVFGYQRAYSARGLYGSIFFLVLVLGMARFVYVDLSNGILVQFADKYAGGKPIQTILRGYVSGEPVINGQTTQFNFRAKEIILPDRILSADEVTKITIRGAAFYEIGDTLEIQGLISRPHPVRSKTPLFEGSSADHASEAGRTSNGVEEGFDYVKYLKKSGINTIMPFPTVLETRNLKIEFTTKLAIGFKKSAAAIKNRFERAVNSSIAEPNASYINGILLGSRQNIPDNLKEAFNKTGTTHILAISGYNIMIISWAVLMGLTVFFRRRTAFWISVAVIFLFVILTGASSSVVRAAIMGLLLLFAQGYGRLYNPKNSIILAGAAMAYFNPFVLSFDIGFQLSFAAVLGLMYLYPYLDNKFRKIPELWKLKELTLMTVSAQLTVAPLLIYYFHRFSLWSLPTNILVLPFVPFAMLIGFISGIGGMIFAPLGQVIGYTAWAITTYQIEVVKIFAMF